MSLSNFWNGSKLKGYLNKKGYRIKKIKEIIEKQNPPVKLELDEPSQEQKEKEKDGGEE